MPTLKKPKKKPIRKINTEDRLKVYQTLKWKTLRLTKLADQPLCELCLEMDKITPAVDVHHIDSFINYNDSRRLEKAYDYNNLLSLCKECHSWLHRNGTTKGVNLKEEAKLFKEYKKLNSKEREY